MLVKIVILCENSVGDSFNRFAEHGFSAYIETEEGRFLFDTGQTNIVVKNAEEMCVDLSNIDAIILSHGHYDHSGGLEHVLRKSGPTDIYAHPTIFEKKWLMREGTKREIGIPLSRDMLEQQGAKFHLSEKPVQISSGIWLSGEIKRDAGSKLKDVDLYVESHGQLIPDEVRDDQALYIEGAYGVVIVLGCTHSGLGNTLNQMAHQFNFDNIKLLIGGLHLFKASEEDILKVITIMEKYKVRGIAVSHCTGFEASAILKRTYGDNFELGRVGSVFILEV